MSMSMSGAVYRCDLCGSRASASVPACDCTRWADQLVAGTPVSAEHAGEVRASFTGFVRDQHTAERRRCLGAVELLEQACRQDIRDATPAMRAHEEGRHAGIRQVLQILRKAGS